MAFSCSFLDLERRAIDVRYTKLRLDSTHHVVELPDETQFLKPIFDILLLSFCLLSLRYPI